VKLIRSRA